MGLGIAASDFTSIVTDWGRSVTVSVSTKSTQNITEDESLAYATGTSQTVIFLKRDIRYLFDKEGIIEQGDAYIMAPTSLGLNRDDKITFNSEDFLIKQVIRRFADGSTTMFDWCVLYKIL